MKHAVVVGAGQAGASLVAGLRKAGFGGKITLVGAEPVLPYQRPPLSKGYLLGELALERLFLRPERFYHEEDITLRLGQSVQAIDPAARIVVLDGWKLNYDMLALTTGSRPRHLPKQVGGDFAGVHVVRTLSDVDALAPAMVDGARALVVGGGYIGLEAAAVAAKLGVQVTLVEMADRILKRVAAPETGDLIRDLHAGHGVRIRESTGLVRLTATDGRVTGAELSDGSGIGVDFVVVGVGIVPETELAETAGLVIDNGIAVDVRGQTSDCGIWAAGDCTSFPWKGRRIRLESVPNAIDQADIVARNMAGEEVDYVARPWFWSDQYDMKLQMAGLNTGYDHVVRRGDAESRSHWYFEGDRLVAVDAMNAPRDYMIGKRLIDADRSPAPGMVADPTCDLKALLRG